MNKITPRHYQCPSLQECSWEGPEEQIQQHFATNHGKLWTDKANYEHYISVFSDTQQNILMVHANHKFLLQLKTDVTSKQFWCGVRHLGEPKEAIKFRYEVTYRNGLNQKLVKSGLMQVDGDWTFDADLMMEFDLNSMRITENIFKTSFRIDGPRYNNFFVSKLLVNRLKCSVCRQSTGPPIFLCETGHSVCDGCKKKSNRCNYKRYSNCNLRLIDATKYVQYPCKNEEHGCTFMGTVESGNIHNKACAAISCLVDDGTDCKWKGTSPDFWQHLTKIHPQSTREYGEAILHDFNVNPCKDTCFMSNSGSVFKMCLQADYSNAAINWTCQQIGLTSNEDARHRLIIEFVYPTQLKKEHAESVLCCILQPGEEAFQSLHLTFDKLKPFFAKNKILLKYKIIKLKTR